MNITEKLFELQDTEYKLFHQKLMPTVSPDTVIGIRIPLLRSLAKEIDKNSLSEEYMKNLPHKYYEENNLHAFLIEKIKDFDKCIEETEKFLPFVDNWATCDSFRPKCFKNNTDKLLPHIENWLSSSHTYTVRFAIEALMLYYLDEHFDMKYPERISLIRSDEYYINMMIAWYFEAALLKQYKKILPFLTENKLPVWIHNKIIQKCIESHCFTKEQKEYLKTLKKSAV